MADPRRLQWADGEDINERMDGKPRLGYDAVIAAIAEHMAQLRQPGN